MKLRQRFYKEVTLKKCGMQYCVCLDGREIKTPEKKRIEIPSYALAQAVVQEWQQQAEQINPMTMPMMRLLVTCLDQIALKRAQHNNLLAAYIDTDLLCYRSENQALARKQAQIWGPLMDWASSALNMPLISTDGLMPIAQKAENRALAQTMLGRLDDWQLGALAVMIRTTGSFVLGLAVYKNQITALEAYDAASLEEEFQSEQWGVDQEALSIAAQKKEELVKAADFLALLSSKDESELNPLPS